MVAALILEPPLWARTQISIPAIWYSLLSFSMLSILAEMQHSSMDKLNLCVDNRYRLERRLGGGGFGVVYEGLCLETGKEVALKLEHVRIDPSILKNEIRIYEELAGGPGIPRVYWHGQEGEYRVMVFDLLGPSLEDLFNFCGRRFSLKTVLVLADQLISRFQYIHSKGFIHRDIKPENMLMGDGRKGNQVYVTDMGLGQKLRDRGENDARCWKISLTGTARYASINGHSGVEQSRRDDMESLGYVLLYFIHGSLPWQGLEAETQEQRDEFILEKKRAITIKELCGGLSKEFLNYFNHVRSLRFKDKPKYAYLRKLFRDLFLREGYKYDNVFDWTELKFLMAIQSSPSGQTDALL
ncbi:kinase-like protein [Lepidopterella palustris CBS 459.81]|uniref:non-specific serine/threonine protein kinase n=1 Tax=Lepidopterella palustris CBS 459.81 TaxID=1314670 RepID=A0A8E2E6J0_9PEZI|nr:kinase-like protein [Lepidopterella palustris CBS 459.81]